MIMIYLNSCKIALDLSPSIAATPSPMTNAKIREVVTLISGGISIANNEVIVSTKLKLLPPVSSLSESIIGKDQRVVK